MHLFVAAALVVADQLSKLWAAHTFAIGGPELSLGLGFYFTNVRNTGAAFGILQNGTLILGILSAVVSFVLLVYLLRRAHALPKLQLWALTLVLAGAVGNMIDRFWLGYVRDFIHFQVPGFDFPVFNIADSCVVIGAALLLLSSLLEQRRVAPEAEGTTAPTSTEDPPAHPENQG